jgi:hypothetical protein
MQRLDRVAADHRKHDAPLAPIHAAAGSQDEEVAQFQKFGVDRPLRLKHIVWQ